VRSQHRNPLESHFSNHKQLCHEGICLKDTYITSAVGESLAAANFDVRECQRVSEEDRLVTCNLALLYLSRKRVLGTEHPDTLSSMANLASTFWNQGRWKEAEELEVQVMETSLRVLGAEHPDTLTSMNNLSFTRKEQGRTAEAIELMETCAQLRTKILGAEHPYTLSSSTALMEWEKERLKVVDALPDCVESDGS